MSDMAEIWTIDGMSYRRQKSDLIVDVTLMNN